MFLRLNVGLLVYMCSNMYTVCLCMCIYMYIVAFLILDIIEHFDTSAMYCVDHFHMTS